MTRGLTGSPWDAERTAYRSRCRACLPISGRRPGAEEAARRKGRSALLRARGLRGLRATSRSFGLAAGFGFRIGMAVFGPDAGDPNEPWAQRVNHGLPFRFHTSRLLSPGPV